MEVSKLCFICFKEGSLNSNETPNGAVTATQENVGVGGERDVGQTFATRSYEYLASDDTHHHNGREEQEASTSQDDFGFVCGECEAKLKEFCEMHAQLQDIQKRINGKVGEISEVMTKAEHQNERKEEFEAYQRCLQLQQKRRGQNCVDVSRFRKDFLERVLNLVSKPHPVADESISSGFRPAALNNEVVDANSSSSFQRVQSAHQPSVPDSHGNSGIQTSSNAPNNEVVDASSSSSFARVESPNQPSVTESDGISGLLTLFNSLSIASVDSTEALKNEVVITVSRSSGDPSSSAMGVATADFQVTPMSSAIAEKSRLVSSISPAKPPMEKQRRGRRFVDVSGAGKDPLERVQIRNLASKPLPVASGSSSKAHNNEVVGTSSSSVDSLSSGFVTGSSAQKHSDPLTEGSGQAGNQNLCFNPSATSADSEVAHRNEVVSSKSDSMVQLRRSSRIAKKSTLVSSNSTAKPPHRKRARNSNGIRKGNRVKHHCVFCGKYFFNLDLHIITHTKEKWYGCKICGNEFSVKAHLLHHIRSHTGKKLYECEICKKRLTTSKGKEAHLRVHTGEKPYKCQYCEKAFTDRSSWWHHEKIHERKQTK